MDTRHTAEIARRILGKPFVIKLMARIHAFVYRISKGAIGGKVSGLPVLLLTTRGRTSGLRRTTPLCYLPLAQDGGGACHYAVAGAYLGSPQHPQWYRNLQATSVAELQVKGERYSVISKDAEGTQAAQLWADFCEGYPGYEVYQAATERPIPIVLFEPY